MYLWEGGGIAGLFTGDAHGGASSHEHGYPCGGVEIRVVVFFHDYTFFAEVAQSVEFEISVVGARFFMGAAHLDATAWSSLRCGVESCVRGSGACFAVSGRLAALAASGHLLLIFGPESTIVISFGFPARHIDLGQHPP